MTWRTKVVRVLIGVGFLGALALAAATDYVDHALSTFSWFW
jgi:hypothetical protein